MTCHDSYLRGCYRPSHKPFVCHLVGTASALAMWGQSTDIVAAGLLHSAYLYGDFGDCTRLASQHKRQCVQECVGRNSEMIIYAYTQCDWSERIDGLRSAINSGGIAAIAAVIKLADLCDECTDAGPVFAPGKPLEFDLPADLNSRRKVLELAETAVGVAGRNLLAEAFSAGDGLRPPSVLVSTDRSYHVVAAGAARHRSGIRLSLGKIVDKFSKRNAA